MDDPYPNGISKDHLFHDDYCVCTGQHAEHVNTWIDYQAKTGDFFESP